MEKKPSKPAASLLSDAEKKAHAAAAENRAVAEGRAGAPVVVKMCPMMSGGIMIATGPITGKLDPMASNIVVPDSVPKMAPAIVPCQERQCALAVGDDEFGFIGCGLVAAHSINAVAGADIANALDRLRDALSRVLGAGPGLAAGMIAMQGATLELKKMLSTVGLVNSEIVKQTAVVTKLVNHLIDRVEKAPKPPPQKGCFTPGRKT